MRKKVVCLLLTLLLVVLQFPFSGETVKAAASTPSKMANIVLFISFSDTDMDASSDYWNDVPAGYAKKRWEEIYNLYNVTDSGLGALSVKDYYSLASCGKFQIENIMPQIAAGSPTIVPIKLDGTTTQYNSPGGETSLLRDVAAKLNQNSEWLGKLSGNLDYNKDGYIDNVTFVVAYGEESNRNKNFYPHKANAAGYQISINGMMMNCYNIINYGRMHSVSGGAGVIAHEFMHVLGPLDTYRVCGDGTSECGEGPVGCWDIMAETSYRVQYPLAYTRQELGWINIDEALVSGTYTLSSPQSDSNHYAMILKTSYSDTEFFVVEYRKKGSVYNKGELKDKIDAGISESGIIVYRVNLAANPKANLYSDYIYLFRQGENETTASKSGARNKGYLSTQSGRTSFGTADVSERSSSRAITYTDGTNSGIVIRNVGSAGGDTITFDLEYSIDMGGKAWDSEQYRYIPVQNGSGFNASILNGTLYGSNMKIISYNGKLYGLRSNESGRAELYRYTNGSWKSLKVLTPNKYSYDMDFETGTDGLLYIVCGEEYTGLKVYSMNASETLTDITGGISLQGSVANPKITVTSAGVAVAYRDWKNGEAIRAYLRKGTTWQVLNTGGAAGNDFQICGNGSNLYLTTIRGNGNFVYQCNAANAAAFTKMGNEFTKNNISFINLVVDKHGVAYVGYYDTVRKAVLVQGYQNGAWKQLGMNVCTSMVASIHMVVNGNKIYAAYQSETQVGIKSHAIFPSSGTSQTVPPVVYTQTEAFVARLYEKCLGRKAEADGLSYWNQVLVSKEKSGAQVGYGFVFSQE
ncbi:MAG: DUF4214 domain-containing protein, partial [Lachnospiraceae bacterium]|nr:DUF4214 domain-containing protein [Lachnospiraceae bacterium]